MRDARRNLIPDLLQRFRISFGFGSSPLRPAGLILLLLLYLGSHTSAQTPTPVPNKLGLVWDALTKESTPKEGVLDISYTFAVTNRSTNPITIERVDTSCGCTVAEMPSEPWKLAPGEGGIIKVEFDARGKTGTLTKTIYVVTSTGDQTLTITTHLPESPQEEMNARDKAERVMNMLEATKNRQAVFQGKCVTCHVQPTIGKTGKELYDTACGICHDAKNRASMVANLKALKYGTPKTFWEQWIRNGKPMSLMPAFEKKQGGPLTEEQIKSLVEYISASKDFPSNVTLPSEAAKQP